MINKYIYITLQKEFVHSYPDAPDEVCYLRYPHRHIAYIKVQIEVFSSDREIEFIMFKHWLDKELNLNTVNASCETMTDLILHLVQLKYGDNRDVDITVSEDDENGAVLSYRRER